MKRQRSMEARNEENVIDDDVSISQYQDSQFQRELQQNFNALESSILHKNGDASPLSQSVLMGISKIDWEDESFKVESKKTPQTQTAFGNVKLAPVSSSPFPELGNFFGLPAKVKALIQEFKGIDELYGELSFVLEWPP